MWVYRKINEGEGHYIYTVGYYNHYGEFITDDDFDSREKARDRINYLNGGNSKEFEEIMSDICDLIDRNGK